MKPTKEEQAGLTHLLTGKFKLSTRFINILVKETASYDQLIGVIGRDLSNKKKLELLINSKESMLFAGKAKRTVELRAKLIDSLNQERINSLFDKYCTSSGNSRAHKVRALSEKRWHSGKSWPLAFVSSLGIPKVFAGVKTDGKQPPVEDIDPFIVPPNLTEFQEELKDSLLSILNKEGDKTRCIVSLPTGGGKTRTAVEAFIEWLQPRFNEGKYLIWIAQSEELCNQAIECIRQLWASKQFSYPLRVYRYFGGEHIDESDLIGGVVVSSINQLNARINNDETLSEIVSMTGSVIIDEAHRAATSMYHKFFSFCKDTYGEQLFPICGLTATPGRSFGNTPLLVELFESKLFTPTLGEEFRDNPLKYFREEGYLARPIPKQVYTDVEIPEALTLFDETKDQFEHRMNHEVIGDLAKNTKRNKQILSELLNIEAGKMVLVYACTVEHAEMLATLLNYHGRSATSISADTPRHYRRRLLEQFKSGDIEFVVNYGVLTTGFDAPKTEYIVICRPTFSEILYEQIVGRGLRGPKFGGTEKCTIIDFCDNYQRFGDQLAYHRFANFWS